MAPRQKHSLKGILFSLILPLAPPPASAGDTLRPPDLPTVAAETTVSVRPPATLVLKDGTRLLPALLLPQDVSPLLPDLIGHPIQARAAATQPDRHGRLPVQIVLPEGADADGQPTWWQADAVRAGRARLWADGTADPAQRRLQTILQGLEDEARRHRRGHWQDTDWQIACATAPATLRTGIFTLVQGRVQRATLRQGTLWLDFGIDRKGDTSVTVSPEALKTLPKGWRSATFWPGKTIEARGWVQGRAETESGPRLDLIDGGHLRLVADQNSACLPPL